MLMSDTPPPAPEPPPSSPPPAEPEVEPVIGRAGMAVVVALPLHALALWLLTFAPGLVESVYGHGLFPLLSSLWSLLDLCTSRVPSKIGGRTRKASSCRPSTPIRFIVF